jgi:hypothetical protein
MYVYVCVHVCTYMHIKHLCVCTYTRTCREKLELGYDMKKRLPGTKHLTSHRMVFLRISQVKDSMEYQSVRKRHLQANICKEKLANVSNVQGKDSKQYGSARKKRT